ncbi:MAG: hypothetical protein GY851_35595 [bacterium]|nr:hypothetical protein [bacterium]
MKTTRAQFGIFRDTVAKWVDLLGLGDWHVVSERGGLSECDRCAEVQFSVPDRDSICRLSEQIGNDADAEFKDHAMHEVLHLLLADLYDQARNRDFNLRAYEMAEHAVIARLTRVLRP